MSFLSKFFDYNKFGPGVSKEYTESGLHRFFRILKSKFWKICALNLIFVVCLIPIIAMSVGIYQLTPLSNADAVTDYLRSEGVSADFVTIAEKYISTYKPDEKTLIELKATVGKLVGQIKETNPDLITDGTSEFDPSKFSEKTTDEIISLAKSALNVIEEERFELKEKDGKWTISDLKSNDYILTTIEADGNKLSVVDTMPGSYTDYFYWILVLLPFALIGPATAGLVKVTRDFVREEPVFLFSDFSDAAKKNFLPSLIISFIQYIAAAIIINAISLYYAYIDNGFIYTIGFAASLFMAFIFVAMHFYIMLMQVTLKLNLKQIYKNAFFFSIICLFRNIFLVLGIAVTLFALWVLFFIGQAYGLILAFLVLGVLTFLISFMFYVVISAAYPPIKKVVIDPYYEQHKEETSAAVVDADGMKTAKEKAIDDKDSQEKTSDTAAYHSADDAENEESEYVYHNGRMIHRSALENDSLFRD